MFVKICGITNEDDALLAVAMGADAVGFVFAPSPRQIAPQQAYDITRRLPPEVLTVGVFRDEHPKRVVDIVHRSGVKAAQLHGNERPDDVAEVAKAVKWVIKAYPAGSVKLEEARSLPTDLILLDAPTPGSGHVFDWTLAGEVPEGVRLILAGGLDPDNVADAVKAVEPWGVDVSTGVERSPGRKDALKVKRFIERARAAAPAPYLGADELPYDWGDE
jgi:phosphoribosylanthranilate isomerase